MSFSTIYLIISLFKYDKGYIISFLIISDAIYIYIYIYIYVTNQIQFKDFN